MLRRPYRDGASSGLEKRRGLAETRGAAEVVHVDSTEETNEERDKVQDALGRQVEL